MAEDDAGGTGIRLKRPMGIPPITVFQGDWTEASQLMQRTWSENKEQGLDYTEGILQSYASYPGTDLALFPAIYESGELQALVGVYPRSLRLWDRDLRVGLMSFFSVASACKGKGYGKAIWAECLWRLRQGGFDGALHYCVEGNLSNAVTLAAARAAGMEMMELRTIPYYMRMCQGAGEPPDPNLEQAVDAFTRQTSAMQSPARRLWTEAEIRWQLQRPGAVCASAGNGMLTGVVMKTAGPHGTPCLFVEDILWSGVEEAGRAEILLQFLDRAAQAGAKLIFLPDLGYERLDVFRQNGFRKSARRLRAYLTVWDVETAAWFQASKSETDMALYMDVF